MEKFSPLLKLKVNNFSLAKSTTSAFSFSCLMRKTQKFSPSKHDKRKSQQQARATCRMKTILQQQQQQRPELDCFDNMAKVFRTCDACVDGAFAFYFFFPPFSFFFFNTPSPTSIPLHVHIGNRPGGYLPPPSSGAPWNPRGFCNHLAVQLFGNSSWLSPIPIRCSGGCNELRNLLGRCGCDGADNGVVEKCIGKWKTQSGYMEFNKMMVRNPMYYKLNVNLLRAASSFKSHLAT